MFILETQDLKRIKLLGQGAFGKVYSGKLRDRRFNKNAIPISVAIKDIPLDISLINKEEVFKTIQMFNKELEFVKKFASKYLIKCYGYVLYEDRLSLVIEYCSGGSLDNYFKELPYKIDVEQKIEVLLNTAKGIKHLHNLGIVHRDIKSMNILLKYKIINENIYGMAKLADFGICQTLDEIETFHDENSKNAGTPQWMSPEDLRNEKPSLKSDIYAFGILIWELFSEKVPYADNLTEDGDPLAPYQIQYLVPNEMLRPRIDLLKNDTPMEIIEYLQKCWHDNKDLRPSIEDIIIFIRDLNNKISW